MDTLPVLLVHRQPLSHDVGIGQGRVRHRRHEEHGDGGQAVDLHLSGQALDQVINNAGGIAGHQDVATLLGRVDDRLAKLDNHGVRVQGGGLGEAGHDQTVGITKRGLVHGPRMGG
jgi:hypothetical protein